MLDRQHLSILREWSRAGSATAAAERLNLSQSAVSHAISKLEDYHQVKIWRRKGRSLELTQAGEYLLSLAERVIPEFEHAESILADLSHGKRGRLRIGMECHPCERWLMRVTGPFLQEWPDVELELRSDFRFDGIAALQARDIDVLVTPDPVALPGLTFLPVFDYELRLAVPGDHPLARLPHVEAQDLGGTDLYTVPVSLERLDIYTRFFLPAQRQPGRRIPVESIDLMLQLVAAGRGVSALPDWLIAREAAGHPIAALRLGRHGLHKSIHLGLREDDAGTEYLDSLIDIARRTRP